MNNAYSRTVGLAGSLSLLAESHEARHRRDVCVRRDREPVTAVYAMCPALTREQYVPTNLLLAAVSRRDCHFDEGFVDRCIADEGICRYSSTD